MDDDDDDDEDEDEDASAGGSATAGGVDFQAAVAAFMAVRSLAEAGAPAPWGLAPDVTIDSLRAEVFVPVDDLLLWTSVDGRIYIQSKRSVRLSDRPTSPFGSAVDQFVRLYLTEQKKRPLDPAKDRIVLAARRLPASLEAVSKVLGRIRDLDVPSGPEVCVANEPETKGLQKLTALVKHFWKEMGGTEPVWTDMVPLLRLIYVTEFRLEPDQAHEENAKLMLRQSVLHDPAQDNAAWDVLCKKAISLARDRSGITRKGLQGFLAQEKLSLRVLRSLEPDVITLKSHTKRSLVWLTQFARLLPDGSGIEIPRDCSRVLLEECEHASLLVIGDAGSGKSGLLAVAAQRLVDNGRDVLVLNAAELAAESLGTLRDELGLAHELVDVLDQWNGPGPGFLVIDALDSARDEKRQVMLRQLIDHVQRSNGRWRVVATIRKYDLANGRYWRRLMPGKGIRPYFDPAYDHVRHLNVEKLTDSELESLKDAAPELHKMIATAPPSAAELVRVPFNLKLAAELLAGGAVADLGGVTTQLQLLDLYWTARMGSPVERSAREAALRSLVENMVQARRLEAPAAAATDKESLEFLLREAVLHLREDGVQFAHHILFDYAVERLLLRPETERTIQRLEQDRDLALSVVPSLKYWVEGHWERDPTRDGFWKLALRLVSSSVPSIAKIVGGTVAAVNIQDAADARGLIQNIGRPEGARLFHYIADALTGSIRRGPAPGAASKYRAHWFRVLALLSDVAPPPVLHRASFLLHELLNVGPPTADELADAGRAARRMLGVAWTASPRSTRSVTQGLRAVGRTFESNVAESTSLLERAIQPDHIKEFGHEELRWLGDEVLHFVDAPNFVARLYGATFAAVASSEKVTEMSSSQILGMTSNAEQDLKGAQWVLAKNFPSLAKADAALAMEVAIVVADGYVGRKSSARKHPDPIQFRLLGVVGEFFPDTMSWHSAYDEETKIVDAAASSLASLAADDPDRGAELLRLLAGRTVTGWLWRTLIQKASTSVPLFRLLKELIFTPSCMRIFSSEFVGWLVHQRDEFTAENERMLAAVAQSIRDGQLGEVAAGRILSALRNYSSPPDPAALQKPPSDGDGWGDEPDPDDRADDELDDDQGEEMLAAHGISAAEARSSVNLALKAASKAASDRTRGVQVEAEEERAGLAELRQQVEGDGLHPAYVAAAWGVIAEGSSRLARAGHDDVRGWLMEAARRPEPVLDVEADEEFATSPAWIPNQARIEAVDGLVALASRSDDPEVLATVRRLASDPAAVVRFHVGRAVHRLARRHPAEFLDLVEALVTDGNNAVAASVFHRAIPQFFRVDAARGVQLLLRARAVFAARSGPLNERLFVEMLAQYIAAGAAELGEIVNGAADNPERHPDQLERAVMSVRNLLTYSDRDSHDPEVVRSRAIGFVRRVVTAATTWFDALVQQPNRGETELFQIRAAGKLLAHVTQELYFASLAYEVKQGHTVDPELRRRFYSETRDILEVLSRSGIPAAMHYLVETLATFVDLADPADVFLLVGAAVRAGKKGGYQYESLAVKEIVAIVERYLADFRAIFVDSEECRVALREILDTFVDAGWSETHRLVYALDSIYR